MYGHYLRRLIGGILASAAIAAAFNAWVDPYLLFGAGPRGSAPARAAAIARQARHVKPLQFALCRPETVFVGSSRVFGGLDPSYLARNGLGEGYNFGLEKLPLREAARIVRYAVSKPTVKRILLELTYQVPDRGDSADDAAEAELDRRTFLPRAALKALLSSTALGDSLSVLRSPPKRDPFLEDHVAPDGFRRMRIDRGPEGRQFLNVALENIMQRLAQRSASPARLRARTHSRGSAAQAYPGLMATLRSISETCRERRVELVLFSSPVHALTLEWLDEWGEWETFELWKSAVARVAAEEAIAFWDFAYHNAVTTSRIRHGDPPFHLDAAHFTPETGDRMLARMLGIDSDLPPPWRDFGVRLTPNTLAPHFARTRAARNDFLRNRPELVAWRRSFRPGSDRVHGATQPH